MPALQGSLLDLAGPRPLAPERLELGGGAWLDHQPGWWSGADQLFADLVARLDWTAAERPMYDRIVAVPRLIWWSDRTDLPPDHPLQAPGRLLAEHYRSDLGTVGCNYYRDGRDSVAWHADKVRRPADALVVILSTGGRRPFQWRPLGGGPARTLELGRGDLVAMGGTFQARFEHAVPKRADAAPRVSIMYRPRGQRR